MKPLLPHNHKELSHQIDDDAHDEELKGDPNDNHVWDEEVKNPTDSEKASSANEQKFLTDINDLFLQFYNS